MACLGIACIPDDDWECSSCTALNQLGAGSNIVLECPQALYQDGPDPHLTQGLFNATIRSIKAAERDSSGLQRRAQLDVSNAPLPDSLKFYSKRTHKPLQRVPVESQQLCNLLCEQPGFQACSVVLCSSRYAMFGGCAAAADLASEAWLAGVGADEKARELLNTGLARELQLQVR
jgi:hypothetical protein